MNRVVIAALMLGFAVPVLAQEPPQASVYRDRNGQYQGAIATFCVPAKDGSGCPGSGGGSSTATGSGTAATATRVTYADDGAIVPLGSTYVSSLSPLSSGQRAPLNIDMRGNLRTTMTGQNINAGVTITGGEILAVRDADQVSYGALSVANRFFDGANLISARGDPAGAWVHGPASTPTPLGGSIAAGGTLALAFVNTADQEVVNPSTTTLWCSWGTPSANGAGSYPILANGSYRPPNRPAGTFTCLNPSGAAANVTATRF